MKFLLKLVGFIIGLAVVICLAVFALVKFVDPNDYREEIAGYISESLGRKIELGGPIDLEFSFKPTLKVEKLKIANTIWGSKPQMAEIEKASVKLDLLALLPPKKTLEFSSIELHDSKLLSEINDAGVSNWSFGEDSGNESSGSAPVLELLSAAISNLEFNHIGDSSVGLVLEKANLSTSDTGRKVDITGSFQNEPLSIQGAIPDVRTISRLGDAPLDLKAVLGKAKLTAKGDVLLRDPLKKSLLDLTVDFPDLSFLKIFGVESIPPQKEISGSGKLRIVDSGFDFKELDLKVEESDIKGSLRFDSAFQVVKAKLASSNLIVDNLYPQTSEANAEEAGDDKQVFSKEKLPLETLKKLDLDVAVEIAKLVVGEKTTVDSVNVGLRSNQGKINLTPVKAIFYEGALDAKASFDGSVNEPTLKASFNTSQFNYGKYLAETGADEGVSGKADAEFDLSSTGDSPHLLASNLKGDVNITSGEGVVTNNTLKIVSVGIQDILAPLFGKKSDVAVHCVLSSSKIENGVVSSQHQIVDSEAITVFAGGSVDLGKESMDLDFKIRANDPSIASLIPPFAVEGPFSSPTILPKALDALIDLAKTGVEIASDGVDMADKLADLVTEGKIKEDRKGMARCEHALRNKDKLWPES